MAPNPDGTRREWDPINMGPYTDGTREKKIRAARRAYSIYSPDPHKYLWKAEEQAAPVNIKYGTKIIWYQKQGR